VLRVPCVRGVQRAFTELLILSAADHLLLTPGSSYGEQAMAIAGRPAYYVRSTLPNAPAITYGSLYTVRSNCVRTHTAVPSIEGFSKIISGAQCFHPDMVTLNF